MIKKINRPAALLSIF